MASVDARPPDDLAERGRAIFDQLRSAATDPPPPVEDEFPAPPSAWGEVDGDAAAEEVGEAPVAAVTTEVEPSVDEVEASAAPPEGAPEWADEAPPAPEPTPTVEVAPSPFERPLPRVLAIANQKGGVGKTTTAVNLGAALAELGYRVLVVDLDPQGNATTGLGINARNLEVSIYDVIMHDTPIEDCIEPTSLRNRLVAPATLDPAGAETELG